MASNCNNGTSIANNGETSGASLETVGAANQILGQPPLVHMLLGILQRQEHTQGRQTDILEQLVQSERGNNAQGVGQGGLLREFLQIKPPAFSGSTNPLHAEDWLKEMDKNFEAMHCPDHEKVTLALSCFKEARLIGGMHVERSTQKTLL